MQKTKRSGLPDTIGMRHDTHFVEFISKKVTAPLVRMIPLDRIEPNPRQARSELGNIDELVNSIKSKGVLEPIIVRPRGEKYEIIAGERRFVASKNAGQKEIPCIEMNVTDNEAMEISLIENLQRKDLDVFEEADGLKALMDTYGYSHAQISEKIGKARSTITEIINISKIPFLVRKLCANALIDKNRSLLIEISKLQDESEMKGLIDKIQERGLKREDTRDLTKLFKGKEQGKKKPKSYIFNYSPKEDRSYSVRIEFKKESVSRQEIIRVLEDLIDKLKARQ
ncbi:MAG: ParB/RepB/Spo0J family partition protein [Candidatus Aminicenantes bacterium]|nr:ParB/RepB/Spo0J family partition protein [Candidatus Aminicenantes bacterium]